ncbi:MAG: DUF4178 domain-containing protein [Pseudomonadota bacterium]
MHCQNCGAPIRREIETSKLVACTHCNTTQMLVDDVFRNAGQQGVMQDIPGLLTLGREARIAGERVRPIGQIRLSYGRGWWDEFWCLFRKGPVWISVDEGDVAVERPMPPDDWPKGFTPRLGAHVKIAGLDFTVAEAQTAECIAVRGELPEVIAIGERHNYYDLSGPQGALATLERWDGQEAWFFGDWIDPWEVEESPEAARA